MRTTGSRADTFGVALMLTAALGAAVLFLGCRPAGEPGPKNRTVGAVLAGRRLRLQVASDRRARARGLEELEQPPAEDQGMLFIFPEPLLPEFSIKSVPFAVDVVFVSADMKVLSVSTISPDGPRKTTSPAPVRLVLELRGGWARGHGLRAGDPLALERLPEAR